MNGVMTASIISKLAKRIPGTVLACNEQLVPDRPKKNASSRLPIKPYKTIIKKTCISFSIAYGRDAGQIQKKIE